jgi:hypothetical protein
MAATTNPFTLQGTLTLPPDEGAQQVPISFSLSGSFTSLLESRLVMTGAGTTVVPFGTVGTPGAKVLVIEYEAAVGAAPVQLNFNGGTDDIELAPGGLLVYASPVPVAGLTSLSIVRTTDAVIRVRLLG